MSDHILLVFSFNQAKSGDGFGALGWSLVNKKVVLSTDSPTNPTLGSIISVQFPSQKFARRGILLRMRQIKKSVFRIQCL